MEGGPLECLPTCSIIGWGIPLGMQQINLSPCSQVVLGRWFADSKSVGKIYWIWWFLRYFILKKVVSQPWMRFAEPENGDVFWDAHILGRQQTHQLPWKRYTNHGRANYSGSKSSSWNLFWNFGLPELPARLICWKAPSKNSPLVRSLLPSQPVSCVRLFSCKMRM